MDDVTIISLVVSSASIVVAAFCMFLIRRTISRVKEAASWVDTYSIVREFGERLHRAERSIIDQKVKWEILELRSGKQRVSPTSHDPITLSSTSEDEARKLEHSKSHRQSSETGNEESNVGRSSRSRQSVPEMEKSILGIILRNGSVSSNEIQNQFGRSREHTARMMNALFKKGLVARNSSERPFRYTLSEAGRSALEG